MLIYPLSIILLSVGLCDKPLDCSTIENLDIDRYMGAWHEIARYDNRFERDLEFVTANYELLDNGKISVVNRGYNTKSGKWQEAHGKAKKGEGSGQLRVSFFLWFYSDYNIMELAEDYSWAVVGSSTDKYLWILARKSKLDSQTLDYILELIRKRGYSSEKLLFIEQS